MKMRIATLAKELALLRPNEVTKLIEYMQEHFPHSADQIRESFGRPYGIDDEQD